jgi:hypothetical protein
MHRVLGPGIRQRASWTTRGASMAVQRQEEMAYPVVSTTPAAKARRRKNRELSLAQYAKYGIDTPMALQTRMPNRPPILSPSMPSEPGAMHSRASEGAAMVPAQDWHVFSVSKMEVKKLDYAVSNGC